MILVDAGGPDSYRLLPEPRRDVSKRPLEIVNVWLGLGAECGRPQADRCCLSSRLTRLATAPKEGSARRRPERVSLTPWNIGRQAAGAGVTSKVR